MSSIFFRD